MNRFIQLSTLSFLLMFAVAANVFGQQPEPSPANETPTLRLRGVDGRTYDLASMRGEVVLVSFGATWCMPCSEELIALEALKGEYAGRRVRFLWVSVDQENTSNSILRHYARRRGLTMPVLRDPEGSAFAQFSARSRIPMVVFFDREGRFIAPAHFGMTTPDAYQRAMRERIDALLQPAPESITPTVGSAQVP